MFKLVEKYKVLIQFLAQAFRKLSMNPKSTLWFIRCILRFVTSRYVTSLFCHENVTNRRMHCMWKKSLDRNKYNFHLKCFEVTSAKQRLLVMKDCFQSDINRHLVESSVSETWYFKVALNSPLLLPEAFRFELLDRSGNKYAEKIIFILLSNMLYF